MKLSRPSGMRTAARRKAALVMSLLTAALVGLFLFSFVIGRYDVPVSEVVRILLGQIFPIDQTWAANMERAILHIRLPRIALACLVGCSLSLAGTAYQSVFQNPMAAPDILGASSGACFGAALAILLGLSSAGVTGLAFVFSMVTVGLVYLISIRAKGVRTVGILLAGVMVSSLFNAATSYIKLVADPSNQLPAITYWMMGSLSGATMKQVGFAVIPMTIGLIPLFLVRWRMNLLTLGDDEARTMGVNTGRLRLIVVVASTLITAASVSVSGLIGWIGLVVPHLCRKLVGNDYRVLTPCSMLLGATFMLAVDDLSRNLQATEIPIGILTAVIGAPFFLYLITRKETTL